MGKLTGKVMCLRRWRKELTGRRRLICGECVQGPVVGVEATYPAIDLMIFSRRGRPDILVCVNEKLHGGRDWITELLIV